MHTRRLVLNGLLVAAIAASPFISLAAPKVAQPFPSRTPDQLVRDAVALYAKKGSPVWPTRDYGNSQLLRDAHMRAAVAEARWSRMPTGTVRDELTPLLVKLEPGSPFHAAVAYALAYNGVDIPRNADWVNFYWVNLSSASPEKTHAARYWRPTVRTADVDATRVYPALANLYRHTKHSAVLDTLLEPHGLDGEVGESYPYVVLRLTRDFPEAVIAQATRTRKATKVLADALSFFDIGKDSRDSVRPALKRIAAGKNRATARTARLCLEKMNEEGRRQAQLRQRHSGRH